MGIPDNIDNCRDITNPGQLDADDDGKGNLCDPDDDNDHRIDPVDNCGYRRGSYLEYNPDQRDTDHNGIGDACDL
jgi:thrombospondin 2/3/4/5